MKSIRRQLTVRLVLGCALLWALCGLGVYVAVRANLIAEFDRELLAKAQGLASLTERQDNGRVHLELNDDMMPQFAANRYADYFQLRDADGRTLQQSASLHKTDLPEGPRPGQQSVYWDITAVGGERLRAIRVQFVPDMDEEDDNDRHRDPPNPPVSLVVAGNQGRIDLFLGLLGAILLGSEVMVLAGTAGLATLIVRRGLSPLLVLAERASAIDARTPGMRFPTESMPAELLPICLRLNDSLARLEVSFERERQFSSDVAHELRTPIAELRALAEVALRWPDEAGASASLQSALQIALQMEAIVTQLLALMRCEMGMQPTLLEPIDLAETIRRCWSPFEADAAAKHLTAAFDIPPSFQIESDPTLLAGIFSNLLNNAVAYTPANGVIETRLTGGTALFRITVANTVADITASDLPHFFDRYWRKDAARDTSSHNGLGLPLARAFATALGMRLDAELTSPHTLQLTLSTGAG